MNSTQDLLKRNSPSIANKNELGVTIQVFHLTSNNRRIYLSKRLNDIIGVRVRSLSYRTAPTGTNVSSVLTLSSDDMLENAINQSNVIYADPSDPSGSTQFSMLRSLLATWVLSGAPTSTSLNVPNYQSPNYKQPIIWFSKPFSWTSLSFLLESEYGPVVFSATNGVILVLEFFYKLKTE